MAGGWVPDRRIDNTHPYAAVRVLDITHVEMDCARDATRGHTARPRLITECVHLHPRLKTSQMVFFFSFLAIFGSACFLPVKGPLLLTLLKDPPPRVPAVMSRTTSTTLESVEIYLFRVLNWNSGVQGEAGIVGVGTGSHESETER